MVVYIEYELSQSYTTLSKQKSQEKYEDKLKFNRILEYFLPMSAPPIDPDIGVMRDMLVCCLQFRLWYLFGCYCTQPTLHNNEIVFVKKIF